MATLYCIAGSGYSARACWALDVAGVNYRRKQLLIGLGSLMLKLRYGLRGKVTVPLLLLDGEAIQGGLQIAEVLNAREHTAGLLFDENDAEAVREWDRLATDLLDYGRTCTIRAVEADERNFREFLPPVLKAFPTIGLLVARLVHESFKRKYAEEIENSSQQKARAALERVQSAIRDGNSRYILADKFSYADITVASSLHFLDRLSGLIRGVDADADADLALKDEFAEVFAWRDSIEARHRKQAKKVV
mmetsp:Transcript_10050/g.30701  ORF Transcript_10050/g.30701 Transcript_10050/m.30701 type:complete len:248 (-) Transcript_10050:838-1581(-)